MENKNIKKEENKVKKPIHYLIFKILGFILIVAGITLAITFFSIPSEDRLNFGYLFGFVFSLGFGLMSIMIGFVPEMRKLQIKTRQYIQEENKDYLKDIAMDSADIASDAIETTARAIKEGMKDKSFCKYCGSKIDADSKFCSNCGKKLK